MVISMVANYTRVSYARQRLLGNKELNLQLTKCKEAIKDMKWVKHSKVYSEEISDTGPELKNLLNDAKQKLSIV